MRLVAVAAVTVVTTITVVPEDEADPVGPSL